MRKKVLSLVLLLLTGITAAWGLGGSTVLSTGQTLYYEYINDYGGLWTPHGTYHVEIVKPNYPNEGWSGYSEPSGNMTIPSSFEQSNSHGTWTCIVTKISHYAFQNCTNLTSVSIPNTVTTIENNAFYDCSSLASITIPYSVTEIGSYAFEGCSSLNSASLPNYVTSLGEGLFYGCTSLTSVSLPNSVTALGGRLFYGCTSLTSVSIPNTVTTIGNGAFSGCTSLTSVSLPNLPPPSVDYSPTLPAGTFYGCSSLTSVSIPNSITMIEESAFNGCSSLTSVSIPNTVTGISDSAFFGCTSLTSLTIPSSVSYIGWKAFANCSGLTEITCLRENPPDMELYNPETPFPTWPYEPEDVPEPVYQNAFENIPSNCLVYIPCGSTDNYYFDENWSYFPRSSFIEENAPKRIYVISADETKGTARVDTHPNCTSSLATVVATPKPGCTFDNWTVNDIVVSTNATYSFNATANRTLTANFKCGIDVNNLPYFEDFDTYTSSTTAKTGIKPPCWTLVRQDVGMTNAYKPMIYYSSANAHSDNYSLILNKRGIYAMPEFEGDVSTLLLSMYLKQTQTKYRLQVGVISDLDNANTFVPVATINNSTTGIEYVQVDFSSYTGNGHYIAFRNILAPNYTGDYSINYIDDLTLSTSTPVCSLHIYNLPYTDNFDSYTSSTTAKTGVEPYCWTLAHQDVSMTDEYRPMIYYSSSMAHSGNYSLILNKRGIYAMPYFDGNVSTLQLSMYLKQPQAKYQLQVGVMSNLNNANTFVPVATINNGSTGIEPVMVSLASYTGDGHYIAFRNILAPGYTGDYSLNYIDDLTLSIPSYNITATANPTTGGTVSGITNPYSSGSTCTLLATPAPDYVFTNWTEDNNEVSTSASYSFTVTADRTLKANFVRTYTITATADPTEGGTVTGNNGTYPRGSTCTLVATPAPDYVFTNWTSGNSIVSTNTTYSFIVTANRTLKANFVRTYTITANSNPADGGTVTGADTYTNGSNCTLVATPAPGYSFTNWTEDNNEVSSNASYTFLVTSDRTLTANFTPVPIVICNISMDDLPYTDNFDNYTSSTTAKTGVRPPCWTLAEQDVTMTDEYKPMIYYSSANAHSGNYSLILN